MSHSLLHDPEMNGMVFQGRNQSYGAYELRLGYEYRMLKGLLSGIFFFLLTVCIPFVAQIIKEQQEPTVLEPPRVVVLSDVFPISKPKPAEMKPASPAPPKSTQIKFVPPVVVRDEEDVVEEPAPAIHELENKIIGSVTVDLPDAPYVATQPEEPLSTGTGKDPMPEQMESFAVQQQPEFPDGLQALYAFLSRELKYPPDARENKISGTVYVEFIVNPTGQIEHVRVLRGVGGGLDQEALRVVKRMPAWKPGIHHGQPVSVIMRLPVKFQLLP